MAKEIELEDEVVPHQQSSSDSAPSFHSDIQDAEMSRQKKIVFQEIRQIL